MNTGWRYRRQEKKVIKYIVQLLKKGTDIKEVESRIKKSGWPSSIIDKALPKVKLNAAKGIITKCNPAKCPYNSNGLCRYPKPLEKCSSHTLKGGKHE